MLLKLHYVTTLVINNNLGPYIHLAIAFAIVPLMEYKKNKSFMPMSIKSDKKRLEFCGHCISETMAVIIWTFHDITAFRWALFLI